MRARKAVGHPGQVGANTNRTELEMQTADRHKTDEDQEPEGLDVGTSDGWGDYPLDAVLVRTEPRSVSEVVRRIENKRYVLDPDFQRDFVWPLQKQSKLIESCIMRIPLPVFYVAEAPDGRIIVVDGLQRLTTFALSRKPIQAGGPRQRRGRHRIACSGG